MGKDARDSLCVCLISPTSSNHILASLSLQAGEDEFQRLLSSLVARAVASLTGDLLMKRHQAKWTLDLVGGGGGGGGEAAADGSGMDADPPPPPPTSSSAADDGSLLLLVPMEAACSAAAAALEPRLLTTQSFLELVGKLGGGKKVRERRSTLQIHTADPHCRSWPLAQGFRPQPDHLISL